MEKQNNGKKYSVILNDVINYHIFISKKEIATKN